MIQPARPASRSVPTLTQVVEPCRTSPEERASPEESVWNEAVERQLLRAEERLRTLLQEHLEREITALRPVLRDELRAAMRHRDGAGGFPIP